MAKTGRNAPCPCGSGRKYKKCCLTKDEAVAAAARREAAVDACPGDGSDAAFDPGGNEPGLALERLAAYDAVEKRLPKSLRKEAIPLLRQMWEIAEYEARQPEIEAAEERLEAFRDDYERLISDPAGFLERAEALFAESAFEPMRFSIAQLERAFESVGYPPAGGGEEFVAFAGRVVSFLVDAERGHALARSLVCLLPDYVAEERCLDAWVIQHCAILTAEPPEGGCSPFLLCMFMRALREWEGERNREQAELLGRIGVDVEGLRGRGTDEINKLLRDARPAGADVSALEEFLNAHPQLKAQMEAECRKAEDAAIELLRCDEGQGLLLTHDEIEPWLGLLQERITGDRDVVGSARSGKPPSDRLVQRFGDIMYEAAAEIAAGIFTEERLQRLAGDIQACHARVAPDDRDGLRRVTGALTVATTAVSGTENHFLTMLCLLSVSRVMEEML